VTETVKPSTARVLPVGWGWATLDQLFSSITDGDHSAPPQVEEGVPFLVIGDVRNGTIDFSDVRYVPRDYYATIGESRTPRKGDLLYTVTGSFGIPVLVESEREFCVQRHIAILKPIPQVSVRYLAFALATTEAYYQAVEAATGTAQKTVGLQRLRQFRLPLAAAPEQKRIVDAIESYFTRLDDAVATLERVERNLKRYRASVLKSAVEGRLVPTEVALAKQERRSYEPASVLLERVLAERRRRWSESGKKAKYEEPALPDTNDLPDLPDGWCWATIDQLALAVTYGSSAKTDEGLEDGIPVLRMGNIVDGYLDYSELKFLPVDHSEFPELLLRAGDLLFNRTNSAELVGKTAVVATDAKASFASYLIRARFAKGVQSQYVSHFINSLTGRQWIRSVVSQQVGQANVNGSKLKACSIPLPPSSEQVRIVDEVERAFSVAFATAGQVRQNLARCALLRQSILKWAFEDKLADQDTADEPASALLEHIKAEREGKRTKPTVTQRTAKKKQVRA